MNQMVNHSAFRDLEDHELELVSGGFDPGETLDVSMGFDIDTANLTIDTDIGAGWNGFLEFEFDISQPGGWTYNSVDIGGSFDGVGFNIGFNFDDDYWRGGLTVDLGNGLFGSLEIREYENGHQAAIFGIRTNF
jgi:hypothetical protein